MPDMASLRSKIERTEHHVKDLVSAVKQFIATNPYKVGTKRDPQTRRLIYYVAEVAAVPTSISLVASDVICNMISILDHLAYGLFVKGGSGRDGRHIYFPIARNAKTAADYITARQRKVQGMPAAAIAAIDALEPYQTGKGHDLWVLNELNNLSKHRELIAVGSSFRSVNIGNDVVEGLRKVAPFPIPDMNLFMMPADKLCPLKSGDELFIDIPDAEPKPNREFRFDVSLNEPQIIQAKPIVETVYQFFKLVDETIVNFTPYL